jgi:hypothetical protein
MEAVAEKARERIKRLALLFADGDIDREGYDLGRAQAQTDLHAAEAALADLAPRRTASPLPSLDSVLRDVGGWVIALRDGDVVSQRDILRLLVDHLNVERHGWGKFKLQITWTPLAEGLAQLRELGAEAA